MAAEAQLAPLVRERSNFAQRLRRFFAPIEPWYDWSSDATIIRINTVERDFLDESIREDGFRFEIQWLGLHFGFVVGRTPPQISTDEVEGNRAARAQRTAERDASA
jgi:hypothetical protein